MGEEQEIDIKTGPGIMDDIFFSVPGHEEKFENLTGPQVIKAFRYTAETLDQVLYDSVGGGGSVNVKDSSYYRGLVELKRKADELGLTLTGDKIYEDMSPEELVFWENCDPMKASYIVELLSDESSDRI